MEFFDHFCTNTSLHGFKGLDVSKDPLMKKILKRIFWATFIAISFCLMTNILSATLNDFATKLTTINVDTSYRDWNNTFPAVSICMTKGSTKELESFMMNFWKTTNHTIPSRLPRHFRAVQSFMFANYERPLDGINLDNCLSYNQTCGVNITVLRDSLLPKSCHDIMTSVTFLGEAVDCREVFQRHSTEIGDCFIANSLYSSNKSLTSFDHLPLRYSNLGNLKRTLEVHYKDNDFVILKYFIHSPEELPHRTLEDHRLGKAPSYTFVALKTTEMINQNDVIGVPMDLRLCRFPSEYVNEFNLPFSISNCEFNLVMKKDLEDCNCTLDNGAIPMQVSRCDLTSYECLQNSRENGMGAVEKCNMPTCLGMEIKTVGNNADETTGDLGVLVVEIMSMPTLRYIRRVSITKLDIIGKL